MSTSLPNPFDPALNANGGSIPPTAPPPIKPGWQTTEFWTSLVPQAFALLVLTGVVSPGDRATLEGAISNGLAAVAALAVSTATVWRYIAARQSVKAQHAELHSLSQ